MHDRDGAVGERRCSPRVRVMADAALVFDHLAIPARVENASQGGALLYLDQEFSSIEGPCSLTIAFGRDPEEAISAEVRVIHATPGIIRAQWKDPLPPEDWIKLRQLMERELGGLTVVQGRLPMLVWPSFPAFASNK